MGGYLINDLCRDKNNNYVCSRRHWMGDDDKDDWFLSTLFTVNNHDIITVIPTILY